MMMAMIYLLVGALIGVAAYRYMERPSPSAMLLHMLQQQNRDLTITAATLSVALDEACDRLANEFGWDKDDTYDRFYEEAGKKL